MLRLKATGVIAGTANFPDERGLRLASRRGLRLLQHHITPLGLNVRPVSPHSPIPRQPHPGTYMPTTAPNEHSVFWWVICSTGPSQWALWYHVRAGDALYKERTHSAEYRKESAAGGSAVRSPQCEKDAALAA